MLRRFALLLCICLLASMLPAGLAEDLDVVQVLEEVSEVELFEAEEQAAEVGEIALEAGDEGASNAADEPAAKGKKTFVVSHGDLVKYNGKGGKVTIPKGVKVIYDRDAFKDNVTELVFPKTMNTIMDEVFADRTKLKKVTFKSDVFLGEYAFSGCTNLKTVVFPKKFTRIGHESFARCKSLKSIKFPSGLKSIDFGAFSSSGLKGTLTFPDKLESIAEGAFYNCKSLTGLVFPAGLDTVGMDAFAECTGLKSATFLGKNTYIADTALMNLVEGEYNEETDEYEYTTVPLNQDLVIYGYEGSTAEKYASEAGYAFRALPTAVKLDKKGTVTLKKGKKLTLTATLTPATAEAALTWKSSNKKVAKVSKSGGVQAVGKGKATITGTTSNGKTAKVKIKVK